ncbi:MAG: PD-(D/E)XK nuclease family protein [Nanoarchaeota archaeon]|nr:PD-(D/E)XK nuclease family protein [Nanoarchaeota archaeon]
MTCYSHSRLSTFEQCKFKYKLQYIDKVKVDIPTTVEAFMGDLVHRTLEKLYSDLKFQKTNSLKDLLKFYNDLWAKEWTDDILIVKKELKSENYQKMGSIYITDYYTHYEPFDQMTVLGLETQDRMMLSDGNQYHVRIDKLACKDNVYYVCDYKTNSRMKDQEEADSDKQLAMYSIWVKNRFKDAKKVVLLWHMLAFDKEATSERTDKQLDTLHKEIVSKIKEVESCKEFPTSNSALCNYCVFKSLCPSFKHETELEEKTPEEFKKDDGVKFVDAYSALSEQKRIIEKDLESLKGKLIEFAKQKEVDTVFGSNKKASVKAFESISLPSKAERSELNKIIQDNKLWSEFSDLDTFKLVKAIKEEELPKSILKSIDKFVERKEGYRVSVSKIKK